MGEWTKLILTVVSSGAFFTFLGVLVTLYFTRRRTEAETRNIDADAAAKQSVAHKTDADAAKIDAESMQIYVAEIREGFVKWKSAVDDWAACVREKAEAIAEKAEAQAENEQLKKSLELLRQENVLKDKTITELHGRING